MMERETRKGEEKDLRVMEVLHDKDNVIRELNKEVCPAPLTDQICSFLKNLSPFLNII